MCGRYLTPDEAALERAWELGAPAGYRQSYNFAPSQLAPVIVPGSGGGLDLEFLVWGFQPHWAKRAWINARSETVFSSRAFAPAAKRHRCPVPATGWYEWQGEKAPKQPWLIHRDGFAPFAFAGIRADAGADQPGNFAILTTAAAPALAGIHGRMPVVVAESDQKRWLAPDCPVDEAEAILANHRTRFEAYRVSPHVNKPANNDPECIRPLA